jgi:tryptophanyl-tRNA synthetase
MPKPILISGIQPTGKLHLGNYLGALKNFVELQNSNKYHCHFFIADLHSLTEDFNPKEKSKQILELAADFLAAGLNPKKSTIFIQSQIPAHSELAWVLNTITPFGELGRMTQFKEKSEEQKTNVNVGLFTYPILMAADVLLYDAEFVPVGHDQLQHLEFTRTIARKFNNKFGKTFIEPKALLTKTPRIMSLDNPDKKMSKSQPNGCLFLNDSPKTIQEKLARAVTDSGKEIKYDPKEKPAISNLLMIYSALSEEPVKSLEQK